MTPADVASLLLAGFGAVQLFAAAFVPAEPEIRAERLTVGVVCSMIALVIATA